MLAGDGLGSGGGGQDGQSQGKAIELFTSSVSGQHEATGYPHVTGMGRGEGCAHAGRLLMQQRATGAAHSSDYSMWRENQYASNGLRDFAERGEAWALMKEIEAAGEKLQSVHEVFSAPAVPSGMGHTSSEFEVHARHSLVSADGGQEGRGVGVAATLLSPWPPRCPLWSGLSPAPTGLWASTVWTCVMGTAGESRSPWTFTHTTRGQTAASPSPPPTSRPSRRTQ